MYNNVHKKSFKTKIIIPTVIIIVALVVVLTVFLSMRFSALSRALIDEKLIANINSLKLYLDDSKANCKAAAVSMALNPNVIKAIRERNTDELLRIFTPVKDLYRTHYYTIYDNQGVVLARTHEPENFGDSVINQQNVKDALNGEISTYFESDTTVKVSVCTGVPVYDTYGTLIGVVSAGIRFDTDSAVNELKKLLHSEATVFLGETNIATTGNWQSTIDTKIAPDIGKIVIGNKQEYYCDIDIFGKTYKAFYMPLINSKNEAFAVVFLGIPETETIAALKKSIQDGIILGLSGLTISIVLLFFIISLISKPITKLSNDMQHIVNGNLNIDISVKSDDEIGQLGKSLQSIANILHKLFKNLSATISEHEKGNIYHDLDTEKFLGDYKVLVANILELANFSMVDQLTGIPNRRGFDNRLLLEWNGAIREKSHISVLIIDVDGFKSYNDAYGHQQGDVALQTVAEGIKHSIKRSIDFVARWGGEEFIVLLPSTDFVGAARVAEKIRTVIEKTIVSCINPKGEKITISIGVSTKIPTPDCSVDDFISVADRALYKAKETGRNRVVLGENNNSYQQQLFEDFPDRTTNT